MRLGTAWLVGELRSGVYAFGVVYTLLDWCLRFWSGVYSFGLVLTLLE